MEGFFALGLGIFFKDAGRGVLAIGILGGIEHAVIDLADEVDSQIRQGILARSGVPSQLADYGHCIGVARIVL